MYTTGRERFAVVDAQVHAWDGSPHNQAGPGGEAFVADLLRRHRELGPPGSAVPPDDFERVTEDALARDLFGEGHVDRAVLQPVVLEELFVLGFSPPEWHAELAECMPNRFVLSGELDPDAGQPGARGIGPRVRRWDLRGLTLCETRRPGRLMRLADPWLRRVLARCAQAGAGRRAPRGGAVDAAGAVAARGDRAGERRPRRGAPAAVVGGAVTGRLRAAGAAQRRPAGAVGDVRPGAVPGAGPHAAAGPVRARRRVPARRAALPARPAAQRARGAHRDAAVDRVADFAHRVRRAAPGVRGRAAAVRQRVSAGAAAAGWWGSSRPTGSPRSSRGASPCSTGRPGRRCWGPTQRGSTGSRCPRGCCHARPPCIGGARGRRGIGVVGGLQQGEPPPTRSQQGDPPPIPRPRHAYAQHTVPSPVRSRTRW